MAALNPQSNATDNRDDALVSFLNDLLFAEHAREVEGAQARPAADSPTRDIETGLGAPPANGTDNGTDAQADETAAAIARRIRIAGGQIIDLQVLGSRRAWTVPCMGCMRFISCM